MPPAMAAWVSASPPKETASLITPDNIRLALKLGLMTKDELLERAQEMLGESGALSDTYLKQVAVRFVSDEYAAQGVDLDALRSR